MKVAYMMGSLNRGGAEVLMLDVFRNAKYAGLDIIGIHRNSGDLYNEFIDSNWPLYQIRPRYRFDPFYLLHLRLIVKREKVSIIHAQHPLDGFYALVACMFSGVRIALTLHGFSLHKTRWYRILLRLLFKNADMLFFVSKAQMEHYQHNYFVFHDNKYRIIYNSIDTRKFDNKTFNDIRHELGLEANQLLLGSVGNFNSGRDHLTICRALKLLKDKQVYFSFIFVGARQNHDPSLYDRCVDFCREQGLDRQVFFLGARTDVPSILQQIDAFVYSSRHDTFGIAVAEALVSGTPVIVNDWKVMLELTNNGHYAQIYKSGNPGDLVLKLLMLINKIQVYKQKALKQKAEIAMRYDIILYLRTLRDTYEKIL